MCERPAAEDADSEASRQSSEPGAGPALEFPATLRGSSRRPPLSTLGARGSSRGPPPPADGEMRATVFRGPLSLIEAVRTFPNGLSGEEEHRAGAAGEGCGGCGG